MNLTGTSENIALVSQYLSQLSEEYRNKLEQSFGDNLDCDEFVERPDFQAFVNSKYVENNENQCSDSEDNSINNLGGMTLTRRNENVPVLRQYLSNCQIMIEGNCTRDLEMGLTAMILFKIKMCKLSWNRRILTPIPLSHFLLPW
jgi:hypothetical protein